MLPNAHSSEVKKSRSWALSWVDTEKTSLSDERRGLRGSPTRTPATHPARSQWALLYMQIPTPVRETSIRNRVWVKTMMVGQGGKWKQYLQGLGWWRHQGYWEAETLNSGSQCKHSNESLCHRDPLTCSLPSEVTWLREEIWAGRPPREDGRKLELCHHEAGSTRAAGNAGRGLRFSFRAPSRSKPCQHPDVTLLTSRTAKEQIYVVLH